MKFAAFDLEIAKSFPDGVHWKTVAPLGITCAALALSDQPEPRFFQAAPQMSREECCGLVRALLSVVRDGYTLVTWNGTAFDFAVLAQESDMPRECAELALAHVDLMAIVVFKRGHRLSLQKALVGAGLAGKLQQVTLNDGTRLYEMSGKRAPELWASGEYNAVLSYLRQDVMPLLKLCDSIYATKQIRWTSSSRKPMALPVSKLWSVRECFEFPLPDTAWMTTEPPARAEFIEWMPPLSDLIPAPAYAQRDVRELPLFAYAAESAYWREFRALLHPARKEK